MAFVRERARRGEGLEVFGLGQLRHKILGLDGQPHFAGSRREVEVEASLEAFLDKAQGLVLFLNLLF